MSTNKLRLRFSYLTHYFYVNNKIHWIFGKNNERNQTLKVKFSN